LIAYSVRRLLGAIPTLLVLVSLSFFMMRAVPGGPFDKERQLPPEVEANLRAAYHLDEPVYQQLGRYLLGLAQLDFGPSFQYRDYSVTELVMTGFPVSLRLGGSAMLVALVVGVAAGCFAAFRQNSAADHAVMGAAPDTRVRGPLALAAGGRPRRGLHSQHGAARRGARASADRVHLAAHARQHDRGAA
jgi:oligopeptide transport system permease protein